MANILTDSPAAFSSDAVFNPAKVNSVPRLPGDSWQYPTAQWASEVDTSLVSVNSWLGGLSPAGTAGTNLRLLGRLLLAENAGVAGGDPTDVSHGLAVGATSDVATSVQIQTSNSGVGALYFSDSDALDVGGFEYDHLTNVLDLRVAGAPIVQATSAGALPASNVTFTLGSQTRQWSDVWGAALHVTSSAAFGLGAAAFDVEIDGGAGLGQEPRLVLKQAGVEIGALSATSAGAIKLASSGVVDIAAAGAMQAPRLNTAQRLALPNAVGLFVYDTNDDQLYWNNGAGWLAFVSGAAGGNEILLTANAARYPAADGASTAFTTGDEPVVLYPDLATKKAEWRFKVPSSYTGGNVSMRMRWTGFAASVDAVEWEVSFRKYSAGDSLAIGGLITTGFFTLSGPPVVEQLLEDTRIYSNAQLGSPVAGDVIKISVARNGGSGSDVYANSVYLLSLDFTF